VEKVFQRIQIFMIIVVVFCTVVLKGNTAYGASLSPKAGDYITLGNIKEPIIWEVVSVKGKVLTLMSYSSVGEIAFNSKEVKPCGDWSTSKVKEYLNTSFYENNFTTDEKKIIMQYNPKDENKVYIPSLKELGLNDSKTTSTLDKTYKEKTNLYQGEKFQKITLNMYQKESGWGASFATRNSDNSSNRVITVEQKGTSKPKLSYSAGFMKMNVRPVIKITTDFKTDNLQFTKGTKKINNKSVTLYSVENKIQKVYVNGAEVDMGLETPKLINNAVLVPLSIIADSFKASVDLNTFTQTITLSKDLNTVKLTINSNQATVNGKLQTLEASVLQEGNVFYIPAKSVAEALGGESIYKDNQLNIKTK
jgi:hypothetical protein